MLNPGRPLLRGSAARHALGLVAALALTACNMGGQDSETKTIDNFAAGSLGFHRNFCQGDFTSNTVSPELEMAEGIKVSRETFLQLQVTVASTLSSVPDPVRSLFFASGGAIRLSDRIATTCKDNLANATDLRYANEGQAVEACWDADVLRPVIYVAADPVAIQHHLVRMMALVLSRLNADAARDLPKDGSPATKVLRAWGESFAADRTALANAFIAEVAERRKAGDTRLSLDAFQGLLRSDAGRRQFEHFLFAESFDSYYCTTKGSGRANTRQTFRDLTPKTYEAFARIAPRLEQKGKNFGAAVAKKLPTSQPKADAKLALAGASTFALGGEYWGGGWNPANWPGRFSNAVESMFGSANTGNDYYKTGSTVYVPPTQSQVQASNQAWQTLNADAARVQGAVNSPAGQAAVGAAQVLAPEATTAMRNATTLVNEAPARAQGRTDQALNGTASGPLTAGDQQQFQQFGAGVVAPATQAYGQVLASQSGLGSGIAQGQRVGNAINDPAAAARTEATDFLRGQATGRLDQMVPGAAGPANAAQTYAPAAASAVTFAENAAASGPAPAPAPSADPGTFSSP